MPEPKKLVPVETRLAESRRLLAEMDALLQRVRALLGMGPTLVAKAPDEDDNKRKG